LASICGGSRFPSVSKDKGCWSLRAIWTALSEHKELTCGYKTFIAHVRRLQQQAATTPKAITPEKRKGFTWDPTPNREELIG
jgi:hypothetical protein